MDVVLIATGIGVAAGLAGAPLARLVDRLGDWLGDWRHRNDPPTRFFVRGLT